MIINALRKQELYAAIHEAVMDVRVRAKREGYGPEDWDREAFRLPEAIYQAVLKTLNVKE